MIHEAWEKYLKVGINSESSEQQIKSMKMGFYAGFISMFLYFETDEKTKFDITKEYIEAMEGIDG
jgi:hypothetical protein